MHYLLEDLVGRKEDSEAGHADETRGLRMRVKQSTVEVVGALIGHSRQGLGNLLQTNLLYNLFDGVDENVAYRSFVCKVI